MSLQTSLAPQSRELPSSSRRTAKKSPANRPALRVVRADTASVRAAGVDVVDLIDPMLKKWLGISARDGRLVVNRTKVESFESHSNALWITVRCYDSTDDFKLGLDGSPFDGDIFVFADAAEVKNSPYEVMARVLGDGDDAFICTSHETGLTRLWSKVAIEGGR